MSDTATLSTVIDARVKSAITALCKRRGIKLRNLVEQAFIERLEDEIDIEAYYSRRNQETIPADEVFAKLRKKL